VMVVMVQVALAQGSVPSTGSVAPGREVTPPSSGPAPAPPRFRLRSRLLASP